MLLQQLHAPNHSPPSLDPARQPHPLNELNLLNLQPFFLSALRLCCLQSCLRARMLCQDLSQRMLAVALNRRDHPPERSLVFLRVCPEKEGIHDAGSALGQRACLVQADVRERSCTLERARRLEEHAVARANADADHHCDRGCDGHGAGAANNQR
eukprot:918916-Rhodomonas_salina.1